MGKSKEKMFFLKKMVQNCGCVFTHVQAGGLHGACMTSHGAAPLACCVSLRACWYADGIEATINIC